MQRHSCNFPSFVGNQLLKLETELLWCTTASANTGATQYLACIRNKLTSLVNGQFYVVVQCGLQKQGRKLEPWHELLVSENLAMMNNLFYEKLSKELTIYYHSTQLLCDSISADYWIDSGFIVSENLELTLFFYFFFGIKYPCDLP